MTKIHDILRNFYQHEAIYYPVINSSRFSFGVSAERMLSDLINGEPSQIQQLLSNVYCPFKTTWMEFDLPKPLPFHYGSITTIAALCEYNVSPSQFRLTFILRNDKDEIFSMPMAFDVDIMDANMWGRSPCFANHDKIFRHDNIRHLPDLRLYSHLASLEKNWLTQDRIDSLSNTLNHISPVPSDYAFTKKDVHGINTKNILKQILLGKIDPITVSDDILMILKLSTCLFLFARICFAMLLMLNLKSDLRANWTSNIRDTIKGKRGLSHTLVEVDINAIRYLPKPKEEPKGKGSPKRYHPVRSHWNVSHKTGNFDCMNLCYPTSISSTKMQCTKCNKLSWLKKDYMRGDESLGTVTHDYEVVSINR